MRIYKTINKVPGGLMVVPLFIGMVINTFFPHLLKIGGFTEALSNVGYPTILGMYLFTVGTKMTVRTAPRMLKRGFGIMAAKVGAATLIAVSVGKFFGGDLRVQHARPAGRDERHQRWHVHGAHQRDGRQGGPGTYVPEYRDSPFLTMLILVGAGLANTRAHADLVIADLRRRGAGQPDEDLRDFFGWHEPIIACRSWRSRWVRRSICPLRWRRYLWRRGCHGDRHHRHRLHPGRSAARRLGHRRRGGTIPPAIRQPCRRRSVMADPSYAAIAPIATVQVAARSSSPRC
jgi:2-keto-3-deoxygluconate permease